MNISRLFSMIALIGALFLANIGNAKDPGAIAASVEEYYQGKLPLADISVIASDWDQVISNKPGYWRRNVDIIKAVSPMLWSAIKLCFNSEVRADIKKATKHQLFDPITGHKIYGSGNYIQFFADKYDPQLAIIKQPLMDAVNAVNPIYSTCAFYAQLGLPLVIWTNNDYESYKAKLDNLNKYFKPEFKGIPLKPLAVFVAGANPDLPEDQKSLKGKPDKEYYTKAYAYTKKALGLSDTAQVIFVDDMADNVHGAREFAKESNLPLIAVQYTTPEQLVYDFNLLLGKEVPSVIQDVPAEQMPEYIDPKELDTYLYNRDDRSDFYQ